MEKHLQHVVPSVETWDVSRDSNGFNENRRININTGIELSINVYPSMENLERKPWTLQSKKRVPAFCPLNPKTEIFHLVNVLVK